MTKRCFEFETNVDDHTCPDCGRVWRVPTDPKRQAAPETSNIRNMPNLERVPQEAVPETVPEAANMGGPNEIPD